MTSNVGFERSNIGFNKIDNNNITVSLKNYFNSAFINRIDNILIFNRLDEDNIKNIINKKLDELSSKYLNMDINYDDSIVSEIISESDYYEFGARKIEKIISKYIENNIIDAIINNEDSVNIVSLKKVSEKNITL